MAVADPDEGEMGGVDIVTRARAWIGTPYRHQGSCKGGGADCLGLLRGIWREMRGSEPEAVPPYSADWSDAGGGESLLKAARRNFIEIRRDEARPGDVLLLRMVDFGVAKHVGILARASEGHDTLVHAYSGHGVVESVLTPAWKRRVAAAFRFPG